MSAISGLDPLRILFLHTHSSITDIGKNRDNMCHMAQWKLSHTSQTDVTAPKIVEFVLVKCDVSEDLKLFNTSMCSDATIVHVTSGTHCQVRQILCVASNGNALCHASFSRSNVSWMLETRRRRSVRKLLQLCWTRASLTAWWSTCWY